MIIVYDFLSYFISGQTDIISLEFVVLQGFINLDVLIFTKYFCLQVVTLQEAKLLLKEDDDLIITVYDYWLNKRLRLVCLTRACHLLHRYSDFLMQCRVKVSLSSTGSVGLFSNKTFYLSYFKIFSELISIRI